MKQELADKMIARLRNGQQAKLANALSESILNEREKHKKQIKDQHGALAPLVELMTFDHDAIPWKMWPK